MLKIIIAAIRQELERQRRAQFALAAGPYAPLGTEDWRVTARSPHTGRQVLTYATTRQEARNDAQFLRGAGYRQVRVTCHD